MKMFIIQFETLFVEHFFLILPIKTAHPGDKIMKHLSEKYAYYYNKQIPWFSILFALVFPKQSERWMHFCKTLKKGETFANASFWHPFFTHKKNKERGITWNVFSSFFSFQVGFKCIDVHLELMFYRLVSRSILLQRLKVAFTAKKDPLGPGHNKSQLWKRSKKRVNFSLSFSTATFPTFLLNIFVLLSSVFLKKRVGPRLPF